MSAPYPPAPRKLTRSTTNRMIGGVCGGLAEYLNMDATLVRILTVLISLFTGVPVILYIIALFVIPEAGAAPSAPWYPPVTGAQGAPAYPSSMSAPPTRRTPRTLRRRRRPRLRSAVPPTTRSGGPRVRLGAARAGAGS